MRNAYAVSRIGKLRFNRAGLVNLVVIRRIELCRFAFWQAWNGRIGFVELCSGRQAGDWFGRAY